MTQMKIFHANLDTYYLRGRYQSRYSGIAAIEYDINSFLKENNDKIIIKSISRELDRKELCVFIEYITVE